MLVTTIDRVQPTRYTWPAAQPADTGNSGSTATTATGSDYVGRHRKGGMRMLSLRRLRYAARHLVLTH
jgi:hypothetical protein